MPLWLTIGLEIAKVVIGVAVVFSAGIAYKAYKANLLKQDEDRARDSDKELFSQSQVSLEWAYNALTDEGKNLPPSPNRLNWLTSARHIRRHDELASKIRSGTYKTIHAEIEEYWRHKFYLALRGPSLMKSSYFGSVDGDSSQERISPVSALVVLNFSRWKNDVVDPLDGVDQAGLVNGGDVFKCSAGHALRTYLYELEVLRANVTRPITPDAIGVVKPATPAAVRQS